MRRLLLPHLALWVLGAALIRVALIPPESCPAVDAAGVRATITEAVAWLERGVDADGSYVYGYHKDTDRLETAYNSTRHAGAVYSLYRAETAGLAAGLAAGDAGLGFLVDGVVSRNDWSAYAEPSGNVDLGTNGLFLVALAERRLATGDRAHDDLMRGIGRFIIGQQEPNGGLLAYWSATTGAPVPGQHGIFATGEAFWGLVRLHRLFPGEGWDEAALRTAHYLANDRDRLEGEVTMYPDHWAAYGMADLAAGGVRLTDDLADYARRLAGFFSVRIRVESQRTGEGLNVLVRGWPGPPSGVGAAGEGMVSLWRLAGADDRLAHLRPGLEDDLRCMAGIMAHGQFDAAEAADFPRPGLVQGAWFYRDYSQVDDQQHTIAALVDMLPIFETERR